MGRIIIHGGGDLPHEQGWVVTKCIVRKKEISLCSASGRLSPALTLVENGLVQSEWFISDNSTLHPV